VVARACARVYTRALASSTIHRNKETEKHSPNTDTGARANTTLHKLLGYPIGEPARQSACEARPQADTSVNVNRAKTHSEHGLEGHLVGEFLRSDV